MRHRTILSQSELALVAELREQGLGWEKVARKLGYGVVVIRNNADPEFRDKNAKWQGQKEHRANDPRSTYVVSSRPPPLPPPDTRTVTGRLFGDPLPGRSALDRRRGILP